MSNTNDKQPHLGKGSSDNNDAKNEAAESKSMFDSIKQYFSGKSGETPMPSDVTAERAVDENGQVVNGANGKEAGQASAEVARELQGAPDNNGNVEEAKKPEEGDKPKELTLEDIEKLQAAAAGEAEESGFSVPKTIVHNNRGEVDSLPRDLGLNPIPPLEQKILPTVLEQQTKIDNPVQILDLTPKLEGGDAVVNENDLLASRGPGESEGSDPVKEPTTVQGDFKIVAPDGVAELSVEGHVIISNGVFTPVAFDTPLGSTLSITGYNPNTGVVTYEYTLKDNQQHPSGNGTNSIFEDFNVHLKDTDGDTADGTLSINIIDDVPSISVSESLTPYLIVDETSLNVDATGSFAQLFNAVPGADGATIVYNLSISSDGAPSGLVDTATQQPVLLFMDGNDIVGRAGNEEVFRISINPNNADVTLNQERAVVHADPNNPDDSAGLISNSLIKITATITDADGDVASATKDIGNAFIFKDDAPSGTIALKPEAIIATDESAGLQGSETSVPAGTLGQTFVSYNDLLNDTTTYGADGAGTKVFTLEVVDGTASGFKTPDGSQDIVLVNNNGVVEGHVGNVNGALAFTVSADANGITLTQYLAVQHSPDTGPNQLSSGMTPGVLSLIETVTDADGDHIAPAVDLGSAIRFYDDAPSGTISLKPGALVATDESAGVQGPETSAPVGTLGQTIVSYANLIIDNTSYGSDGAGSKSYALSVVDGTASGFKTPDGSQDIVLVNNNGVIEGHVGNVNGTLAFTVSADNNGITLTQYLAIQHSPDSGPNQLSGGMNPGVLTLVQTITDADGDKSQSGVDLGSVIKFYDDAPSGTISLKPGAFVATDETPGVQGPENLAPAGTLGQTTVTYANLLVDNTSYGSDGPGTKSYSLTVVDGSDSGFKTPDGSQSIVLFNNGGVIEGHVGTVNGALAFTVSANANGITLTQYLAIQHSPDSGPNQLSGGMKEGALTLTQVVTDADGDKSQSSVDLSSAIKFYDDAPSGMISLKPGAVVATDETVGKQGTETSAPAGTLGQTIVTYANLLNDSSSFGSDGPGSKTYALSVVDGTASGFKTPDGSQNIVLVNNNGVVEGHVGNVNGALAFTVSASATGITLTQYLAVQHSPDTGPNQLSTGMATGVLTLTQVVTDADGDKSQSSVDLGSAIKFYDDAPTGTICLKEGAVIATDETAGKQGPETAAPAGTLGQTFALYSSIITDTTSFGSDGAGTKTYSLSVVNGADSGFKTPDGSQNIVLLNNNGVIEGHVGNVNGALAFTVSASATGITLTQYLAVQHSPDTGPNQLSAGMKAGVLSLTETVTDADGDHIQPSVDLGSIIKFYDDAPSGKITLKPDAFIATDESAGLQGPETSAPAGTLGQTTVTYANLIIDNTTYGSDGAGSKSYALSVVNGADSGFKTPDGSQSIVLFNNGGVIEGHVGNVNGALAFTVSANANGITLTQYLAIQHSPDSGPNQLSGGMKEGALTLTQTITDADGDKSQSSVDLGSVIKFYDDAPSGTISLKPGAFVATDETPGVQGPETLAPAGTLGQTTVTYANLLVDNTSYGSDGAGSKSYSLSVVDGTASGFKTSDGSQNIVLVNNNGVVEGHVGNVNGALAFTVSASPTGITLTQYLAIQHAPDSGPNQLSNGMSNGVLTLTQVITDADGDKSQSSVDLGSAIKFYDDAPSGIIELKPGAFVATDETVGAQHGESVPAGTLGQTTVLHNDLFTDSTSYGSDGAGSKVFNLNVVDGTASGYKTPDGSQDIVLKMNNGIVEGHIGNVNGAVAFTVSTNASGDITLTQYSAIQHSPNTGPDQLSGGMKAGVLSLAVTVTDADGDKTTSSVDLGSVVKFYDDAPTAVNDDFNVPTPVQPPYNLTFVLDVSGSMGSVLPNSGGKTRLQLLKEALTSNGALLDSYAAASSALAITIVTFSNNAQTSLEFHDVAAAKAYINALTANGTTNYQAAANATTVDINADGNNAALNGYINRLYWLSDGEPNPASTALTNAQEQAWRDNLNSHNIEAYMLNIGGSNANITANLADLDDDQPGVVITVAPNLSNLQQILVDTVNQVEVQGNVLTNDHAGSDGGATVINIFFDLQSAQAANAYLAAHPELVGATVNGTTVTIPIPNADITTPVGNKLHMNADGSFTYISNSNNSANGDTDALHYTMRDADGDPSTAEFNFHIDFGVTITNLTPKVQGGDVTVNENDLLASRGPGESAGSQSGVKDPTTQPGDFNIKAPNGLDSLVIGGKAFITGGVFTAGNITTPLGNILAITGYDAATGKVSYTYTLTDNENHPSGNGTNDIFEDFAVVAKDKDGSTANDTLSARIIDDVPTAVNDTNSNVASESNLVLTGNVKTNDIPGADGASVTPQNIVGTYGTLVLAADGSYTYTLNTNDADFKALGGNGTGVENFNYNLVDADGDSSTAKLTLNIKNNDDGVTITNLTPKAQGGDVSVNEDDLLANRGAGESAGSDASKESTTQPGDFNISAPDGLDSLVIGGKAFITGGVFTAGNLTSPLGNILAITGYDAATGKVSYTYTLTDNENHPSGNGTNDIFEDFAVIAKDKDGSTGNDTLSARIIDDVPKAVDDVNGVASETNLVLTGNVKTNDIPGADGASVTPQNIVGTYGTLVLAADGSYTYTLNTNDADFKALGGNGTGVDVFNYNLVDGDGDSSTAKLTLSIKNNDDGVTITNLTPKAQGGDVSVNEDDLLANRGAGESAGSDASKESTTQPGDFNISAPDGLDSLVIGGKAFITGGVFTAGNLTSPLGNILAITGYDAATGKVSYTYTLTDNENHPSGNGTNDIFEDFAVVAKDKDGSTANDTLSARIIDDVPTAVNDTNANVASETNLQLVGNVRTNDIQGADGANVTPQNITGTYGTLVLAADGSYTYTLNTNDADFKALGGGGVGVENFNYNLVDADGDSSSAQLTLNIKNNDDGVTITDLTPKASGGDASVNEDDLLASRGPGESAGSDPTKESTTTTGDFKISAPDGIANLTIGGKDVIVNDVFTATSITSALGNTLNITGYNAATGVVSYSYTLNDNENHPSGQGKNSLFDDFTVSLKDRDGDSASNTLSINIIDDVPTAVNDVASIIKPALPAYNLVFDLDVSGSMGDVIANTGGKTRLQILKEALTGNGALLDSYAAASSALHITFVTFSTNAQTSQAFTDIASAKAFVNGLTANGSTNYTAAMNNSQVVMNADKANASLANYIDKTYFISDGQPNVGTPNSSNYQTWQNNIANNGVDAIIINIAPPANQANINQYLTPLANPGDNPAVYGVNADLSNLPGILIGTINDLAHINGNVLTNDVQGADGHLAVTQIQFSFANAAAATAYINAHPELVGATANGVNVTIPVPQNADIVTPLGEKLHIETDGDYTYTINGSAPTGKTDSFTYTAVDADGDPTSAQVQISIESPQAAKMTVTSFAVTSTAADSHDSIANHDVAFATTKSPYVDNVMNNDVVGDKGAKVVQISFETDDAAKYIKDNHLDALNATVDKDGKTVHIPLPEDGSEIEFATPHGGSLAANNSGEYAYTVKGGAEDQVEHFKYTLQDQATGNLHDADLDVNVFKHPDSLVNLMGSDANDIMSSANHNAEAIMMEGGKGINDFIIDVGDTNAPETIFIKDLGINKQNVLSFVNVSDANHDGKVSFMDAVESFHQDGPNANLEITLQNKTTLVLENVGTVPGHDMQALQQHLETITAELHVVK